MATRRIPATVLALAFGIVGTAALAQSSPAVGECPQPRFTGKAPTEYYERMNPLPSVPQNLKPGEQLFLGTSDTESCAICHGRKGDGRGALAKQYDPPPRNFACAQTINGVPDGQLFWIIRFGSPGTGMPPHPSLKDDEVWQMVSYLRQLAK